METKSLISHILFFLVGLHVAAAIYLGNYFITIPYFTRPIIILLAIVLFILGLYFMDSHSKEIKLLIKIRDRHESYCLKNKTKSTKKTSSKKSDTFMNDRDQVACSEDHELEYVLRKFGKRGTKKNIDAMREVCKEFKSTSDNDDREHFYQYLEDNNILDDFE